MITKILFFCLLFAIYNITIFIFFKFKKSSKLNYQNFPTLTLKKNGIFFTSKQTHRLKIINGKYMLANKILYLNLSNKLVVISNIKDIKIFEGYLYFTALGEVEITVDNMNIYRYFALKVNSSQFDFNAIKQKAIKDYINNNFDINLSKNMKKYIKIIEEVLNIHIYREKIVIKSNKFRLKFQLIYKLNNKIKRIIVN